MSNNSEINSNPSNLPISHKPYHRKDVNDIVTRQYILAEIIFNLKSENKPDKPKVLLEKMKEKGYDMDRSTLYRDRLAINQRNSFLRDLSESNYSNYIENMWGNRISSTRFTRDVRHYKKSKHQKQCRKTNLRNSENQDRIIQQ